MHDTTGHATRQADADATGEAGVWVDLATGADLRDRAERAELLADRLADGLTEGPRTLAGPWAGDSVTIP